MKKILKSFLCMMLISILVLPTVVKADDYSSYYNLSKYRFFGDASSDIIYSGSGSVVSGPSRCGTELPCFDGAGLYIYLVKYSPTNPPNTREEIIGTPVLIYSGGFLNTTKIEEKEASVTERAKDETPVCEEGDDPCTASCTIKYKYQTVVVYPTNKIEYSLEGYSGTIKKYKSDSVPVWINGRQTTVNLGTVPNGFVYKQNTKNQEYDLNNINYKTVGNYVNTIIEKIINENDRWTSVGKFFDANIEAKYYDQYYLAFEIAKRTPSGSGNISGYISKTGGVTSNIPVATSTEVETSYDFEYTYKCEAQNKTTTTTTYSTPSSSTCPGKSSTSTCTRTCPTCSTNMPSDAFSACSAARNEWR